MEGSDYIDYDVFYEPDGDWVREEYVPDPYFLQAREEIKKFFNDNREAVLYMRQLQVKYEKEYYHWITRNGVVSLNKQGYLKQMDVSISASGNPLHLHFFTHHTNRYPKREANALAKLVAEYSQDHIMRSCGNRAEVLFAESLAGRGFTIEGKKVREYKDKKWTKTKHDLDYIFKKEKMAYGCEIKNKLAYIDKEELEIKLDMCKYLDVYPLFIMRYSPKTYNDMIIKAGGFALLFKAQIYDLSQKDLVDRIKKIIGYEVDCPRAIPTGIIDRFEKWHIRKAEKE